MYQDIRQTIDKNILGLRINENRRDTLKPLTDFLQQKINTQQEININFICTHNSRRSHFAQVWAQAATEYFHIPHVHCFSGGTEVTAVFPEVIKTLQNQGFNIFRIAESNNPIYAIKYSGNAMPIISFSKKYDSPFNPASAFIAIMTCSQAESACPFIAGAESSISIAYEDPKLSDNTPEQSQVYAERSLQIASEMFYVFSMIKR